jgi:hypothetical protein
VDVKLYVENNLRNVRFTTQRRGHEGPRVSMETETSFRHGSITVRLLYYTKLSLLSTQALYEPRRVTISGEGYVTNRDVNAPTTYLLAFNDAFPSWEVNEDGNTR